MNKFFIVMNGHVSLYCREENREGNIIEVHVINGCWEFLLDLDKMTMTFYPPRSEVQVIQGFEILVHKPYWPSEDYNEAIMFAEAYMKKNFISRFFFSVKPRLKFYAKTIKFKRKLLKKSIKAGKQTWDYNSPHTPIDWDDEIPF